MYDAADSILAQKLAQVEGVGQVFVWGSSQPAMRAEVNPSLLNKLGIGLDTVRNALNAANANRPRERSRTDRGCTRSVTPTSCSRRTNIAPSSWPTTTERRGGLAT